MGSPKCSRGFGAPAILAHALRSVAGVTSAFVYGSWAARFLAIEGQRPVEDVDLLVLGEPDRDANLYKEIERVEARLGRRVRSPSGIRTGWEGARARFTTPSSAAPWCRSPWTSASPRAEIAAVTAWIARPANSTAQLASAAVLSTGRAGRSTRTRVDPARTGRLRTGVNASVSACRAAWTISVAIR